MVPQYLDADVMALAIEEQSRTIQAKQALAAVPQEDELIAEVVDAIVSDFEDHILRISGCPAFFTTNLNGYYQVSKSVVRERTGFE